MGYFNLPFSVRISNDNPIDGDRYIATNLTARDQLVIDERAHVGLQVYVLSESKLYILDTLSPASWKTSIDSTGGTITGGLTISEGGLVVDDDVSINGNLFVDGNSAFGGSVTINGSLYVTNVESIDVSTTFIKLNTGLTGAPPASLQAGIIVERGSADPYIFVYDEDEQIFRIGIATLDTSTHYNDSSTQAVATRQDNPEPNGILHWDASFHRMDTHPGFVYEVGTGIGLPVANDMSSEMTALVWDGATIGSRELGTMAFETSTNYYGKTQIDNQVSAINASIYNLRVVDSSLGLANIIQNASIVALRNTDLSQDASIENLRLVDLSLEASIARIDVSLNDTIDFASLTYSQLYIDGSLTSRDSSIIYLFDQISQLDASIVRIDASLNDVVDAFGIFLPTASIGYGLVWNGTHLLDVSIVIPAPDASFSELYAYIDGSLNLKANNASLGLYVKKAGDTMSGALIIDASLTISAIFAKNGTTLSPNGKEIRIKAGNSDPLSSAGGPVYITAGDNNSTTQGPGGEIYISPGRQYTEGGNYVARVFIGNSLYNSTNIMLQAEGSNSNVSLDVAQKGNATLTLGNQSGNVYVYGNNMTFSGPGSQLNFTPYDANLYFSSSDGFIRGGIGFATGKGYDLTIAAGKAYGYSASHGDGGVLYLRGGNADSSIAPNIGGDVVITGGKGVNSGAFGKIKLLNLDSSTRSKLIYFDPDSSTIGYGNVPSGGGGTTGASNGLRILSDGSIGLGGFLTQNTSINLNGTQLKILNPADTTNLTFNSNQFELNIGAGAYLGSRLSMTSTEWNIWTYAQGGYQNWQRISGTQFGINIDTSGGIFVSDLGQPGNKGLIAYQGNYTSSMTSDRQLPDIGFVRSLINTIALSTLSDVSISSLGNLDLLQFDTVSGKWKNVAPLDASTYFQKKVVYNSIPTTSTTGTAGDVVYDASYLYVCTSTNKWGRVLLDYGF